ncbi:MAG: hypothetical protein AAF982_07995 [Pseudomonadota bacterium]
MQASDQRFTSSGGSDDPEAVLFAVSAKALSNRAPERLEAAGVFDRCLTPRTECIYPCNRGPVLALYPRGHWYRPPARIGARGSGRRRRRGRPEIPYRAGGPTALTFRQETSE